VTDREVALAAARRAGALLHERAGDHHDVERKSAAGADVVSAADRDAEAAVVELLRAERPDDGVLGEEGARIEAERTWVVDALDGTFNYVSGVPSWCAAVALTDGDGPLAAAVCAPSTGEEFSAARGEGAGGLAVRRGRRLADALVSTFADDRVLAPQDLLALVDAAAVVRTGGAGSLELAWVAAGRIDAWVQRDPAPWDWLPGALLVREAGGRAEVLDGGWHLAAGPDLFDELAEVVLRGSTRA
jgi:fructose-1,6-bisphosphatase/inositol monophosphatase family enzyme